MGVPPASRLTPTVRRAAPVSLNDGSRPNVDRTLDQAEGLRGRIERGEELVRCAPYVDAEPASV